MKRKIRGLKNYTPLTYLIVLLTLLVIATFLFYSGNRSQSWAGERLLTVQGNLDSEEIAGKLQEWGLINNSWTFLKILDEPIKPGGYYLSGRMNTWEIIKKLEGPPDLIRLTIPEGWRKEQIACLLADELNWTSSEKKSWLTEFTEISEEESEGVYFPDTYLIPRDESPKKTARRLRNHFNEIFKKYAEEALQKNIKWTTLVTLASIIEREASGNGDRPLIAGILWNRLLNDMKLDADSTIQYIRDSVNDDGRWWEPLDPRDKQIDSPFNTYRNSGLPPAPINNPGCAALEAALKPKSTEFLYYLHDDNGDIHCARNYEEHLENIKRFLKEGK